MLPVAEILLITLHKRPSMIEKTVKKHQSRTSAERVRCREDDANKFLFLPFLSPAHTCDSGTTRVTGVTRVAQPGPVVSNQAKALTPSAMGQCD